MPPVLDFVHAKDARQDFARAHDTRLHCRMSLLLHR